MYSIRKQRGMTAVGWVFVFLMIAVVTLIVLKLLPLYLDGFSVSSTVASLEQEHNLGKKSPSEIKRIIMKRLDVNMVDGVTKDDIYIDIGKGVITIEVDYEVRENLAGNLDVVVSFNSTVDVPTR